ncbi:hypothetical protein [Nannocystis sp.]|uniref:hypothetical protein n=1 Tax=Nannocystis sp. TaxID=1962667 RepID=UPI0025E84B7C|nr:hypothetical protein [Nannocystis sp.]MBK7827549.1 hypothetical protein [Nannocystis sp.]
MKHWLVPVIFGAVVGGCGPEKSSSEAGSSGDASTGGASSSTGGVSTGSSTGGPVTTGVPQCPDIGCNNDCGNGCTPEPVCDNGEVICDCGNCNESVGESVTGGMPSTGPSTTTGSTSMEPDTTTGGGVDCSGDPPSFPEFDRSCVEDVDCALVLHQIDCCGTFVAWGLRADVAKTFAEAEALCESQYPLCGCAAQPTVADDGMASNNNDFAVTCKDGSCFSFVP